MLDALKGEAGRLQNMRRSLQIVDAFRNVRIGKRSAH
jgi:hypothetical protein